jgi:hypothetical protein
MKNFETSVFQGRQVTRDKDAVIPTLASLVKQVTVWSSFDSMCELAEWPKLKHLTKCQLQESLLHIVLGKHAFVCESHVVCVTKSQEHCALVVFSVGQMQWLEQFGSVTNNIMLQHASPADIVQLCFSFYACSSICLSQTDTIDFRSKWDDFKFQFRLLKQASGGYVFFDNSNQRFDPIVIQLHEKDKCIVHTAFSRYSVSVIFERLKQALHFFYHRNPDVVLSMIHQITSMQLACVPFVLECNPPLRFGFQGITKEAFQKAEQKWKFTDFQMGFMNYLPQPLCDIVLTYWLEPCKDLDILVPRNIVPTLTFHPPCSISILERIPNQGCVIH